MQTLLSRLESGQWPEIEPAELNAAATALGPNFNIFANTQGAIVPVPPAFVEFHPAPYLRPFDADNDECRFGLFCGDPFARFFRH